jgi:hypothetical protein
MTFTLEGKGLWADCEFTTKFRGREYGCQYAEAFVRILTVGSEKAVENPVPGRWYSDFGLSQDE